MAESFTCKHCGLAFESRVDLMNHTRQQHLMAGDAPAPEAGSGGQRSAMAPSMDTQERFKSLLERWGGAEWAICPAPPLFRALPHPIPPPSPDRGLNDWLAHCRLSPRSIAGQCL